MRNTLLIIAAIALVCSFLVPNHAITSGDSGSVLMSGDAYIWIAAVCGVLGFFWPKTPKDNNKQ